MTERRRYKNPPIEEAVCEIGFDPGKDWDLTVPGKLQMVLGEEFSGKPEEKNILQVELKFEEQKRPQLQYGEALAKVQLATEDGKRLVAVGPDVLSVHMLRPYQRSADPSTSGWDEFRPLISRALNSYWQVSEPKGVSRIGIRYINKFVLPHGENVEEYLKSAKFQVEGLPNEPLHFMNRVEYAYEDNTRLLMTQALINMAENNKEYVLDLDVIQTYESSIQKNETLEIAKNLRDRERSAFESIITDKARELFDVI